MEKLPFILLVDDEPATNYANERLLYQLGVAEEVLSVTEGEEALLLLSRDPPIQPTLLLLDVNMPGLDGIAFVEAFQRLPASQQAATRIVLLTGGMASHDLLRLNELPIAGLVLKPLTREKIDALLQLHFQRQLPDA
ncbi:response regulator [Hymenobacter cheonanensis]|uniref:response regulator n=1 Tax=Hymenobacter sp. CA2-7 TaxID=3063993 RepID=UPI0027127694|nr:response regulator [Hymenobacter sp. CA2-7]MDO7883886.1 response regulator [Hymenobacter sp. CA2-7]